MDEQTEAIRDLLDQFLEFCSNTEPYLLPNLYTSPEDRASLIDGFLASQPPSREVPYVVDVTRHDGAAGMREFLKVPYAYPMLGRSASPPSMEHPWDVIRVGQRIDGEPE